MTKPLLRLLVGVFLAGWFFSFTSFHSSSLIVPLLKKSLPLIVTVIAGLYLFFFSESQNKTKPLLWKRTFLGKNWFFVHVTHGLAFISSLKTRLKGVLRSLDQGWTSNLGPSTIPNFIASLTSVTQQRQTGNIVNYILYLIILVLLLLSLSLFISGS
jgi:NADH:ubiquinone oxidoreductase subunit 5 (subunit L)/multisubunit Na+/H+ antiporter MnhA subunit